MTIYSENKILSFVFASFGREASLVRLIKKTNGKPDPISVWSNKSGYIAKLTNLLNEHLFYIPDLFTNFIRFGDCSINGIPRKSGTNTTPKLEQIDDYPKNAGWCMEYFDNFNFNNVEENMERQKMDTETATPSFIPVDIGKSYLNEAVSYYKTLFGNLPSEYYAVDYANWDMMLNIQKSMKNIEAEFDILNKFTYRGAETVKKSSVKEVNYVLKNGMLIFLSNVFNCAILIYGEGVQIDPVLKCISKSKVRKTETPKFKLLVRRDCGFAAENFELKKFDVDIESNYNDDLPDKKIRSFIESDAEAGICILHGKPGTGKTYYIRDLIKNSKKDFIYMSKECLNYINDSSFIAFLVKHKNSVFIMEDCENVLVDRTQYNNTISTLLNLSDGLLGDSLNNKFICTFNTDISNVDEALLRKGRMKVCYEFKYLSPERANALAEKLHKKGGFDRDVPLCDVMTSESNGSEDIPKTKTGKIGF